MFSVVGRCFRANATLGMSERDRVRGEGLLYEGVYHWVLLRPTASFFIIFAYSMAGAFVLQRKVLQAWVTTAHKLRQARVVTASRLCFPNVDTVYHQTSEIFRLYSLILTTSLGYVLLPWNILREAIRKEFSEFPPTSSFGYREMHGALSLVVFHSRSKRLNCSCILEPDLRVYISLISWRLKLSISASTS